MSDVDPTTAAHLAADAERLRAGFDDRVPDGPEAVNHPHAAPANPRHNTANVDVTNDFDLKCQPDAGTFEFDAIDDNGLAGLRVTIPIEEGIRLAAYIIAAADKAGIRHQFGDIVEALEQLG